MKCLPHPHGERCPKYPSVRCARDASADSQRLALWRVNLSIGHRVLDPETSGTSMQGQEVRKYRCARQPGEQVRQCKELDV